MSINRLSATSMQLRIVSRWLSRTAVQITVIGEIDSATAGRLEAKLLAFIQTKSLQRMEIDLAGVTFLDCRGLSVLIVVGQAAARAGCCLQVTRPQPIVRRVLELTGLLGILMSEGDHGAAFRGGASGTGATTKRKPVRDGSQSGGGARGGATTAQARG
ncbi:STAS domain-containing protein [Nucisporomicrobium flavum]|uniref:STAS domain-containing protein n=1 Tax=Nucisporomicrobium flavum TaxID=2785915 RepID=UPI003555DABB